MDLSKLSDADLLALYQQEKRKQDTGFIVPQTAPDPIAGRQEYAADVKQLAEDSASYKRAAPLRKQLQRFQQLNHAAATGGILDGIPGLGGWLADVGGSIPVFGNPAKSEMASIGAAMQVGDIPKGQGQVSNFERSLYALTQPGIGRPGTVNDNLINQKEALFRQEGDRLAFRQAFLAANGHLKGADEAWDKYLAANPYTTTVQDPRYGAGGHVALNDKRQDWRTYFGLGPEEPTPSRAQQIARKVTGNDPSQYARPRSFKASNGYQVTPQ